MIPVDIPVEIIIPIKHKYQAINNLYDVISFRGSLTVLNIFAGEFDISLIILDNVVWSQSSIGEVELLTHTIVDERDLLLTIDHGIVHLEVTVDKSSGMEIFHTLNQLNA